MATIILDVTAEAGTELNDFLAEFATPKGVTAEVLQERGPGGGWPEVKFTGEEANLQKFCKENMGLNDEEFADLRQS